MICVGFPLAVCQRESATSSSAPPLPPAHFSLTAWSSRSRGDAPFDSSRHSIARGRPRATLVRTTQVMKHVSHRSVRARGSRALRPQRSFVAFDTLERRSLLSASNILVGVSDQQVVYNIEEYAQDGAYLGRRYAPTEKIYQSDDV